MISAKDFLAKVANGDNMFIIDLRSSEDYAKGHIKGAVNVPFGSDVAKALNQIPDNRPVFVYCYTGQTASQTTALLNVAGKPVTNVRSGFKDISADENFEALSSKVPAALPKAVYPVNKKVANAITAYFAEMEAQTDYKKFNISPKQVKQISDSRNKAFEILSVRKAADYAQGHRRKFKHPLWQGYAGTIWETAERQKNNCILLQRPDIFPDHRNSPLAGL